MKELYTAPECELILFDNEDIITTSGGLEVGDDGSVKLPGISW